MPTNRIHWKADEPAVASFFTLLTLFCFFGCGVNDPSVSRPSSQATLSLSPATTSTRLDDMRQSGSDGTVRALKRSTEHATRTPATFVQERDWLLMLGTMSYMYASLQNEASPGYNISAAIAWNVDDRNTTPEFIFERNRNYQKQGEIFHAEINTLRTAYDKMRRFDIPPAASDDERYALYANDFANAVLFTTLEPCPMCTTTITMAKVPVAIFCMDDPGLRDVKTRQTAIHVPTAFYGRKLTEKRSDLPACEEANQAMWQTAAQPQPTTVAANKGNTIFSITDYIHERSSEIFRPAWDELRCYKAKFREDEGLLSTLQKATGDITSNGACP